MYFSFTTKSLITNLIELTEKLKETKRGATEMVNTLLFRAHASKSLKLAAEVQNG